MDLWLKIKVWTKIVICLLVFGYLGYFFVINRSETVNISLLPTLVYHPGVLSLIFYTFLAGIFGTLIFPMLFRTFRQLRELYHRQAQAQLKTDAADLKSKAAMLQTKPAPGSTPSSSTHT